MLDGLLASLMYELFFPYFGYWKTYFS